MDLHGRAGLAELLAQIMDMHRDSVGFDVVVDSVELLLQHRARHDPPEAPHQVLEGRSFASWQRDRTTGDHDVACERVERYVSGLKHDSQCTAWPAQKRLDACNELGRRERLYQVIVGAGVESGDPVLYGVPGRQHENWSLVATGSCGCKELQAVAVRQAEVEHDRVIGRRGKRRQTRSAGSYRVHDETGFRQGLGQELDDADLVFNQQEAQAKSSTAFAGAYPKGATACLRQS